MTVSTEVDHNDYTGNGVTTSFPYTFRIFKTSDITVTVVDLAENITTLNLDTDYTVSGAGGFTGGNVTLPAPLANGYKISIARNLPLTQETDLRNQGKFFAEVHEDAFDKLTMLIQQVFSRFSLALRKPSFQASWYDALGNSIRNLRDPVSPQDAATKNYVDASEMSAFRRTLRVPESFISELPSAANRAMKSLQFDEAGDVQLVSVSTPSIPDLIVNGDQKVGSTYGGTVYSDYQVSSFIKKGGFVTGGTVTKKFDVFRHSDGMWYAYKLSLPFTVIAGSAPDSNWVCVGILDRYSVGDLRNFKGVGDGVADDTSALIKGCLYSDFFNTKTFVPKDFTFISGPIKLIGMDGLWIAGSGTIKMKGGRTGAVLYSGGAQITFIGAKNVVIDGPTFDGNRAGSPLYTGFNHGIQFVTGDNDYRSNNGGESKPNTNIRIINAKFKNQGSFSSGYDKFGDAIYLFGCDGVLVENVYFENVGRWAVAVSDSINVKIISNSCDNSQSGSVALGFVDVETESTDQVNGTYARDIIIANNILKGFCQILVGGGCHEANYQGTYHYVKNVLVCNNVLTVTGGPHSNPSYLTNLIFMGCAPFCNVLPTQGVVENVNIIFSNNNLRFELSALSIGMGINAQGIGGSNLVQGISFIGNTITGFSKGIQASGVSGSGGYSLRDIVADCNTIVCNGENSIGIRFAATQIVHYMIGRNIIRGTRTRAISIEDARALGAIDSCGIVNENSMAADSGTNMFTDIYRASLIGNLCVGGASQLDMTANIIDKNYGNSWNSFKRTIPAINIPVGGQQAIGGIDLTGMAQFGYTFTIEPPFYLDQATYQGSVSSPAIGTLVLKNGTSSPITKIPAEWNCVVEKR
jgi:hypothetical protein